MSIKYQLQLTILLIHLTVMMKILIMTEIVFLNLTLVLINIHFLKRFLKNKKKNLIKILTVSKILALVLLVKKIHFL